jgi:hypothetical protein
MTEVLCIPRDGKWLAATVRNVAGSVKRLTTHPEIATPDALAETEQALQELREHLAREQAPASPLHGWAENLARQLASIA